MSRLRRFGLTGLFFLALFTFSVVVFFYSPLRQSWRIFFGGPEREILSVAVGHAIPDGDVRVVKVATHEGLFLEIYGMPKDGLEPLIDRVKLPDKRDAFFQFKGRATNLALQDMDGDQVYEIIAPTYDDALVPHINIYRYNSANAHFEVFEK